MDVTCLQSAEGEHPIIGADVRVQRDLDDVVDAVDSVRADALDDRNENSGATWRY